MTLFSPTTNDVTQALYYAVYASEVVGGVSSEARLLLAQQNLGPVLLAPQMPAAVRMTGSLDDDVQLHMNAGASPATVRRHQLGLSFPTDADFRDFMDPDRTESTYYQKILGSKYDNARRRAFAHSEAFVTVNVAYLKQFRDELLAKIAQARLPDAPAIGADLAQQVRSLESYLAFMNLP